jgi:hypothetical protein
MKRRPIHELFIGAGLGLFALQIALAITGIALMMAGVLPFAGPHPFLWIAMALSVWLGIVGLVVGFLRGWK